MVLYGQSNFGGKRLVIVKICQRLINYMIINYRNRSSYYSYASCRKRHFDNQCAVNLDATFQSSISKVSRKCRSDRTERGPV